MSCVWFWSLTVTETWPQNTAAWAGAAARAVPPVRAPARVATARNFFSTWNLHFAERHRRRSRPYNGVPVATSRVCGEKFSTGFPVFVRVRTGECPLPPPSREERAPGPGTAAIDCRQPLQRGCHRNLARFLF